jgi:ribosome maturation factor RimP
MRAELIRLLEPVVIGLGYELVQLEFGAHRDGGILRLFIDRPEGVNVDDCEIVSRGVSTLLETNDPIKGHYTLEVSSPGFDRPLRTREHFSRFVGSRIKLETTVPRAGRRRYTGLLQEVIGETIVMEVDQLRVELPFAEIERAHVVA